jgi:hypothetical protein
MRPIVATILAGAFAACASPEKINEDAILHQKRANYYASRGDYTRAAEEQRSAEKQHLKATRRAYEQGLPPPPVPRPASPR